MGFTEDPSLQCCFQRVILPENVGPRLFIGPREAIEDQEALVQQGVTHVVSVMQSALLFPLDGHRFQRHVIESAVDDPCCNLMAEWPACCQFIDAAANCGGSGVLIHCEAGSSRSGATLVAYLVHHLRRPAGECIILAQRARSVVAPNGGFQAQLLNWERHCLGNAWMAGGAHMHEIRPRLWLGAIEAAADWETLRQRGVTDVMACGRGLEVELPEWVNRLSTVEIDDLDEVDILEHLPPTFNKLHEVLSSDTGVVLVHCAAGRSRSASIVIAYLMRKEGLTYKDARASVELVRSIVQPNTGFSHQLQWYGENGCPPSLCDKSSCHYRSVPAFMHLLRKYTAEDVRALVKAAGVSDSNQSDRSSLQRALDALDRLQNAVPIDEDARNEKRILSRRLNSLLDVF